jgi:LysM repeat protein
MIGKRTANCFLLVSCILFGGSSFLRAQEPDFKVNRSENKIILEGHVYYIHIVREKETLYGIGRAYNVTEKVIASENPDVFVGLRPGMVLKIPAEPVVSDVVEIKDTEEFFYHVVKKGETPYFLSRKYGINVEEIENFNPEIKYSTLQINQVLKIPKRKKKEEEEKFSGDDYIYHYVKTGETLYRLSEIYDVSIEKIKELNPELRWGDLKYDEYIRIPRPQDSLRVDESVAMIDSLHVDSVFGDSVIIVVDTTGIPFWSEIEFEYIRPEPIPGSIKIAMLLPFNLHQDELMDTIQVDSLAEELPIHEEEEEEKIVNPRMIPYLEFYQGAILALDSLKRKGYSITLTTFDTERSRTRTLEILRKREMQDMDLIIGPANFWNLEVVANFAKEHRIPLVSPFSSNDQIVKYNPWVFQLTPFHQIEYRSWAEYLSDNYDKTMILVHNGDSLEYPNIEYLKNEIFSRISEKADLEDVIFKTVIFNDSVVVDMEHVLNKEGENIVIIPSDNEAYVSTVISPLYYLLGEYDIEISGMPQWSTFDDIDLEYFHNLQTSYYTSFYIDYKKEELMDFIGKFRKEFRTEPYKIRPRGYNLSVYSYDIMNYFVPAVAEYGRNLIYYAESLESNPILGPYEFRRINDFGGHVNSYIGIIRFHPDLNIEKVELESRPNQYRYRRYSRRFRED